MAAAVVSLTTTWAAKLRKQKHHRWARLAVEELVAAAVVSLTTTWAAKLRKQKHHRWARLSVEEEEQHSTLPCRLEQHSTAVLELASM